MKRICIVLCLINIARIQCLSIPEQEIAFDPAVFQQEEEYRRQEDHATHMAERAIEDNDLMVLKAVHSSLAPGNHPMSGALREAIETHPDYHGEGY